MKIFFAGTPAIAVATLEALNASPNIEIAGVLTNPDRPAGRGRHPEPTPVKAKALDLKLRVYQPESLDEDFFDVIRFCRPQLLVVFAYGKIFSRDFLSLFPNGGINIHPSLLPRWRGPSPITAALLTRDTQTGLSVQTVDRRMDCGDILYSEKVFLGGRETTESLSVLFSSMAAEAAVCVVENFEEFYRNRTPQDESKATYCRKIRKEDGVIDWTLPAADIDACVRAYYPQPKARSYFNGIELYFLRCDVFDPARLPLSLLETAAEAVPGEIFAYLKPAGFLVKTGGGILSVSELQLKSRKALDAASFKNGSPEIIGARLGSEP